jgi:hypothetical protein
LRPQPAPPDLLRRLPRASVVSATTLQLMLEMPVPEVGSGPEPQNRARPVAMRPAKVEPISETQHVVRDALSNVILDRKLETVHNECIRRTLEQHARRWTGSDKTAGTKAGTKSRMAQPRGRYLPVEVRRQVWRRDEGRCAFVSADWRRCGATYKLEFHHVDVQSTTASTPGGLRLGAAVRKSRSKDR